MPDLEYVKVTMRLGLTVGDGADPDETPDTVWCDEGTVRLVPLNTYTKIAGGSPSPWTAGHSVIEAPVNPDGYMSWSGQPHVWVVDLASPKVNPFIGEGKATHRIEFKGVKSNGVPVTFETQNVRLAADAVDPETGAVDLTDALPVPTAGGTPITVGRQGVGIKGFAIQPSGTLEVELTNDEVIDAGLLPVGPGGSDAGVAGYIATPGSVTEVALAAKIEAAARQRAYDYSRIVHLSDHGAKFDRREATMTTTAGSTTVTSPNAAFTSADIGKLVFILGAGVTAQPWNGALVANIVSRVSATQVTVNVAATSAVSSVSGYIGTNNDAAWDAAHALLAPNIYTRGGTLVMPPGHGMHATQKTPLSYVRYQGAGGEITVMHPVASVNGFIRWGTAADPLIGTEFRDFTIDGDMQTNGAGASSKGFGMYFLRECRWENVTVQNTAGSGFGNDFHQDCYYVRCRAESNGRIGDISSPGHSGFGFGTGGWENEHVFLIESIAVGNMRHGCFLEWQPDITPDNDWQSQPGLTVIGGRFEGNGVSGISDQACGGAIVLGAHLMDNGLDGYSVNTTPPQLTINGFGGTLSNCVIRGNGRWGVDIYYPDVALLNIGRYRVLNNIVEDNGDHGIHLRAHARHTGLDIEVTGNTLRENRKNGIRVGGAFSRLRIERNTSENNGRGSDDAGAGLGGPDRNGIAIHGVVTDSSIVGNVCRDTRATGKTQLHGLLLTATAPVSSLAGNSLLADNDFRGNGTAGIAGFTQVAAPTVVRDNAGFNPVGADAVVPSGSPFTYTAGTMRETLYILGGTFSAIAINGVTMYNAGANAGTIVLPLDSGAVVTFTYSVAPVAIKRWRH